MFCKKSPTLFGILNLTPDSFSDGLPNAHVDDFIKKAEQLMADGADIIDIGAESTRPGAQALSADEEISRLIPFLKTFRQKHPDFPLSLDTKKYAVALACSSFGILVYNDVSFFSDAHFVKLMTTQKDAWYVLMHSRGDSQNMMTLTDYPGGVVDGVKNEILAKLDELKKASMPMDRVILDLGFGFAKTPEQCVTLFEALPEFVSLGLPILLGISRKRFLQQYTGVNEPLERDDITVELTQKALESGVTLHRIHHVKAVKTALNLA